MISTNENLNSSSEKITLQNSTPFEFPEDALFYRVVQGTVYLFAVEKLPSGLDSARTEIAVYKEGEIIVCLPPVRSMRFVLTGSLHAQIESVEQDFFDSPDGQKKLSDSLSAVSILLWRGLNVKPDYSNILSSHDLKTSVQIFAEDVALELCAIRVADMIDEQDQFIRKRVSSNKAFSDALENISGVIESRKTFVHETDNAPIIVQAARLVANYDGIKIQNLAEKNYSNSDALEELAKDSNVRVRSVTLKGKWWENDNGALFGYYCENPDDENASVEPVALLPEKIGGYICVLPLQKKHAHVTNEFARHIRNSAAMFYKPFSDSKVSFKELLSFVFSSRKILQDALVFMVLGFVSTLVGLLIPVMTKLFMDTIIPEAAKNMAVQISTLVLLCILSAGAFEIIKALALTRMESRSDTFLQAAVMDRLLKLPVGFFKDFTAGELSQKVLAISQIRTLVFSTIISSGMSFIFTLVYLVQLFRYSSYLLKWGLFFCLIPILVTILVTFFKYKWNSQIVALSGKISGTLFQFITGINKLVMTSSKKQAFSVWAKLFVQQNRCTKKSSDFDILYATFTSFFSLTVTLCFYGIFMSAVQSGKMGVLSTGSFLAFMASFAAFQNALIGSANAITQSVQIVPLYEQAKTILDALPEIQEAKPAVSSLSGNIEINNVSFRYSQGSPLVLNNVSMKIYPHEFVAIVGGSGSGKSTLMRILLGFEKPEAGTVFFDNHDLNSIDIGSVRRNMGVVLQNSTIMQGSIFTNIIGSSALTIDDAWEAAEMAGLADDIREMPMGMHTMVTSGGGTLSGGQRQRLIIARAIARKPNILIFDEATSALDNKTQAIVSKSLESLNVTRIVIAHRLSTIINADRIYVLNNGIIEESGTYEELIKKGGFFTKLAERQQA